MFKLINCARTRHLSRRRCYSCTSHLIVKELPAAAYKPEEVEKNKYDHWELNGYFKPDNRSTGTKFSMVLPPPNITGKLHLGHALGCTIQDVILRRRRSMGDNVLWVPGIDHAGIATQGVVEKYLDKVKNVNRHEIGKDRFSKEIWNWKEKYGDTIMKQLQELGCSLDWSRKLFTMDMTHTCAVNYAFIELFNRGLIYRKKAPVNWCHTLKSTVSDIEVEDLEIKTPVAFRLPGYREPVEFGMIYNFAYKVFGTKDEIVVSTTMPETMLGDVAVAVNPNDDRYKKYAGKRVYHPFRNCTIPVIMDEFVDPEFGTGAVKITPAHSKVDYQVAKTHTLPMLQVIDQNGIMINAQDFNGLRRYICRQKLVKKLDEMGFMRSIVPHEMKLPICSRTGDVIESLPMEQWFVSCGKMNERAREAVLNGKLELKPAKFLKNWLDWTDSGRDWCISRQLWWGHQIPAYKCTLGKHVTWIAANNEFEAKEQAAKLWCVFPSEITAERDQDVLDTWFSSGIYPFAALGWPVKTQDFERFYPLSLMATGHDILGFWVHRMVMLGLELTNKLPFNKVLLHGVICDNKGAKMSKSKGNVIDPVDVIKGISMEKLRDKSENMYREGFLTNDELAKALSYHKKNFSQTNGIPQCGVDALRFTLLSQDIKSHFVNFDVSMCHANKLFCNKIWQSLRYVILSCEKLPKVDNEITLNDLSYFDKWILSRLAEMVCRVNKDMDNYNFHLATKTLRNFIYNDFCDIYLETTKPGFSDRNPIMGYAHAHTLTAVLNTALRCLNPFMIYLTEELIPRIPTFEQNIIVNYSDLMSAHYHFPQFSDISTWKNKELEERVGKVLSAAALVRELKGLCGMNNRLKPSIYVKTKNDTLQADVERNAAIVRNLAQCCTVDFQELGHKKYVRGVLDKDSEVFVEILGSDVHSAVCAAKMKLQKKIDKLEIALGELEKKYNSQQYLNSVPEYSKVLDKEKLVMKREQLIQLQTDLLKMTSRSYSLQP